jgi:hypothetical protein
MHYIIVCNLATVSGMPDGALGSTNQCGFDIKDNLVSYLGHYNLLFFADKYTLTGTLRRDGSSRL